MLHDALESFKDKLFAIITCKTSAGRSCIIRKHSEALCDSGDFSFPAKLIPWMSYLSLDDCSPDITNIQEILRMRQSDLLSKSLDWDLIITTISETCERINIFLNRHYAAKVGIVQSMKNSELINNLLNNKITKNADNLSDSSVNSLTNLRGVVICSVLENLSAVLWSARDKDVMQDLSVTWKSCRDVSAGSLVVPCGPVLNMSTGLKETTLTAQDYIKQRQTEMTLVAQHKYGMRVSADVRWSEFASRLGEAAVVYELLQVRPSSSVKINFQNPTAGCSKGAAFVLYNCARLETLLSTFQRGVDSGQYPPLPDIEHTDFALLTDEDEWSLMFNFVLGFPGVVRGCLRAAGGSGGAVVVAPHLLCSFLSSLVRTFSQYYRRVRILTEARAHLMPVLFARLRLLTALNQTLQSSLRILNIPAVTQM